MQNLPQNLRRTTPAVIWFYVGTFGCTGVALLIQVGLLVLIMLSALAGASRPNSGNSAANASASISSLMNMGACVSVVYALGAILAMIASVKFRKQNTVGFTVGFAVNVLLCGLTVIAAIAWFRNVP
jgi:hypothetical protein